MIHDRSETTLVKASAVIERVDVDTLKVVAMFPVKLSGRLLFLEQISVEPVPGILLAVCTFVKLLIILYYAETTRVNQL
jgi:hypothetical protein